VTQSIAIIGPGRPAARAAIESPRVHGRPVAGAGNLASRSQQASASVKFLIPRPCATNLSCPHRGGIPPQASFGAGGAARFVPRSRLMLQAMRSGVNECLQYPFSDADLDAAILRLTAARETLPAATCFCLSGGKRRGGRDDSSCECGHGTRETEARRRTAHDLHLAYGDAAVYLAGRAKVLYRRCPLRTRIGSIPRSSRACASRQKRDPNCLPLRTGTLLCTWMPADQDTRRGGGQALPAMWCSTSVGTIRPCWTT